MLVVTMASDAVASGCDDATPTPATSLGVGVAT
jgi:hypothetical protein